MLHNWLFLTRNSIDKLKIINSVPFNDKNNTTEAKDKAWVTLAVFLLAQAQYQSSNLRNDA